MKERLELGTVALKAAGWTNLGSFENQLRDAEASRVPRGPTPAGTGLS